MLNADVINQLAAEALDLAYELWPLNRSLVSKDTDFTINRILSDFPITSRVHEFVSGSSVGDWIIPKGWNVKSARLSGPNGEKIADFSDCNLHLMSYSTSINATISHQDLLDHIHYDKTKPNWIPYRTSYYKKDWGFCLSSTEMEKLVHEEYVVEIDSEFYDDSLKIGEIYLPGESENEVIFSTYVCHPSMANNELSGPVVCRGLAKYISGLSDRHYSYRFLFMPETIGAIAYLSNFEKNLKAKTIAGFVVTCIGDNRTWGYVPSRNGITLADKLLLRVLSNNKKEFIRYSFLERGSDERQFCSPNANLPFASITRSKYGTYPEYHTSGDDLTLLSNESLAESIDFLIKIFEELEENRICKSTKLGEPFFNKYDLRPDVGGKSSLSRTSKLLSDIVALADGSNDLIEIGRLVNEPIDLINELAINLSEKGLIKFL